MRLLNKFFERHLIVVVTFMFSFLIVFTVLNHRSYVESLEVNDELREELENSKAENRIMGFRYREVKEKYYSVLSEKEEMEIEMMRITIPVYNFTEEEVYLLAQCVEAEAGNYADHKLSQRYVTQVILNRLHSGKFPSTIKGVIYQKEGKVPQFSVAYDGKMDREVELETLQNVYSVLVHGTDLPEYVMYFYDVNVINNWVNTLNTYDVVEGTVFAYEN